MTSLTDWLETHSDRVHARQRAEIETAKLLSTFSAGVGGAIVGTAFQVEGGNPSRATEVAAVAFVVGIIALIILVLSDIRREVDHTVVLNTARTLGLDDTEKVNLLRAWQIAGVTVNERLVRRVRIWLFVSLIASMAGLGLGLVALWN